MPDFMQLARRLRDARHPNLSDQERRLHVGMGAAVREAKALYPQAWAAHQAELHAGHVARRDSRSPQPPTGRGLSATQLNAAGRVAAQGGATVREALNLQRRAAAEPTRPPANAPAPRLATREVVDDFSRDWADEVARTHDLPASASRELVRKALADPRADDVALAELVADWKARFREASRQRAGASFTRLVARG